MSGVIKDFKEGQHIETARPAEGIPKYPQVPYPGHPSPEPSCSEPVGKNIGCDAWEQCDTRGEGPYNVVYQNVKKKVRKSTHCRLWHYRLKLLPGKYKPLDDPWVPARESVAIDAKDVHKGTKLRTYLMFVHNARLPEEGAKVHTLDEYETQDLKPASVLEPKEVGAAALDKVTTFVPPPVVEEQVDLEPPRRREAVQVQTEIEETEPDGDRGEGDKEAQGDEGAEGSEGDGEGRAGAAGDAAAGS